MIYFKSFALDNNCVLWVDDCFKLYSWAKYVVVVIYTSHYSIYFDPKCYLQLLPINSFPFFSNIRSFSLANVMQPMLKRLNRIIKLLMKSTLFGNIRKFIFNIKSYMNALFHHYICKINKNFMFIPLPFP